jgi:hypothetical protein
VYHFVDTIKVIVNPGSAVDPEGGAMSQQEDVQAGAEGDRNGKRTTQYFVNGEAQSTTEKKLAVKTILEHASFTPVPEWTLSRDDGNHEFTDQEELVPIHKDERFTATFSGPTPAS